MIKKIIIKVRSFGNFYVGDLWINNVLFCNVIINHDKFGKFPYKINYDYKLRLIDFFKYSIIDEDDPKFNFRGFQIHCGNTVGDSKGCVLVGYHLYFSNSDSFDYAILNNSKVAFKLLNFNISKGTDYIVEFLLN